MVQGLGLFRVLGSGFGVVEGTGLCSVGHELLWPI